jgi:DNA primase
MNWADAMASVFSHYNLGYIGYGERAIRCPAHDDRHASASANGGNGLWHCHACGASGNAVHIIMAKEGLDYQGALKRLEEIVGGKIQVTTTKHRKSKRWTPSRLKNGA